MDKIKRYLDNYQDKTPKQQETAREILFRNLKEAQDYSSLQSTQGWQRLSDWVKQSAEEVGLSAVYPGIKSELLQEKLTRANEGLRIIQHVELKAAKLDELEEKARTVKQV